MSNYVAKDVTGSLALDAYHDDYFNDTVTCNYVHVKGVVTHDVAGVMCMSLILFHLLMYNSGINCTLDNLCDGAANWNG